MSDDEFKHLQNFGKTIEKQIVEKPKKKKDDEKIFPKFDKRKIKYILKKLSKRIIFTKIRFKKHRDSLSYKKYKLTNFKITFPKKQRNYVKCYRLVEKRKQRGNTSIIVRKRVPFKIDISELGSTKTDLEHLINFTFESGIYYNKQKITIDDHKLKRSVWDFKIK